MKNPSPYLKMRVLGAVETAPGNTRRERTRHVSNQVFCDEEGHPRQFTWRTIETWLVRYSKHGVTSTNPTGRSDKGRMRKTTPEQVLEAIEQVLPLFHGSSPKRAQIYRTLIEKGILRREEIAVNTFTRIVKSHELLKPDSEVKDKRRLAFSKQFANQMWQADTLVGPYMKPEKSPAVQTRLIAFIDDASRLVCHAEFFAAENTPAMIRALRAALYKRGVPEQLYVDNGSIYCSKEITLICARIGCMLCHTPIRDGAAKGKIERFFRTVREQFLSRQLDLSSIQVMNRQLLQWVENEYNCRVHQSLQMRPIDRFGLDIKRVHFLDPCEANDEMFYAEADRAVKADNTFSYSNRRFEAPRDLRGKKIQIRFDRARTDSPVAVYFKGQRMGLAQLLDPVANDRKPKNDNGDKQ